MQSHGMMPMNMDTTKHGEISEVTGVNKMDQIRFQNEVKEQLVKCTDVKSMVMTYTEMQDILKDVFMEQMDRIFDE